MKYSKLISYITFMTTLVGWIFTYRSQKKIQKAIADLEEQIQDMLGNDNLPKYSDGSIIVLSPLEMKDLALWYDKAKAWYPKGKSAVDWENKHLRESIALQIRYKLAAATNENEIEKAFQLGKVDPPSGNVGR